MTNISLEVERAASGQRADNVTETVSAVVSETLAVLGSAPSGPVLVPPTRGGDTFLEGWLHWLLVAAAVVVFFLFAIMVKKLRRASNEMDSITFSEHQSRLRDLDDLEERLQPTERNKQAIDKWLASSSMTQLDDVTLSSGTEAEL